MVLLARDVWFVRRAAAIELAAFVTLGCVAAASFWSGTLASCTTLTCYGIFCSIHVISSAALFKRLRAEATGAPGPRPFDVRIARGLVVLANAMLALYAGTSAALDLYEPRADVDPLSLSGACAALVAFALVALIVVSQRSLGRVVRTPAMHASSARTIVSCAVTAAVVAALLLHVFVAEWWIDTIADVGFTALACASIVVARGSGRGAV